MKIIRLAIGTCVTDKETLEKNIPSNDGALTRALMKNLDELSDAGESIPKGYEDKSKEPKPRKRASAGSDVFAVWKSLLQKKIVDAILEAMAEGTVGMTSANLMQVVRPPSGGPTGTNVQYYYKNEWFPQALEAVKKSDPRYQRFIIEATKQASIEQTANISTTMILKKNPLNNTVTMEDGTGKVLSHPQTEQQIQEAIQFYKDMGYVLYDQRDPKTKPFAIRLAVKKHKTRPKSHVGKMEGAYTAPGGSGKIDTRLTPVHRYVLQLDFPIIFKQSSKS